MDLIFLVTSGREASDDKGLKRFRAMIDYDHLINISFVSEMVQVA